MSFVKSCYCGKSNKTFKFDIGPGYLATCCEVEGYDNDGNPPKKVEKEGPKRNYVPSGKYSKKPIVNE